MSDPRVLICDDSAEFRTGLRTLLEASGIDVVGEVADGSEVVQAVAQVQPDVVLMDLKMPGVGGVEATRLILRECPHVGVVVLTMVDDDDAVFAAMRAGARGYLLKGARRAEILRAIEAVAGGEGFFGSALAGRLMTYFDASRPRGGPLPFPELTAREHDILALMARHLTNPTIAGQLGISEKTVRNNVSSILTKLCVADRARAIILARDAGLGS
jgi:DNA-binding NarL/FixJ family response regulator